MQTFTIFQRPLINGTKIAFLSVFEINSISFGIPKLKRRTPPAYSGWLEHSEISGIYWTTLWVWISNSKCSYILMERYPSGSRERSTKPPAGTLLRRGSESHSFRQACRKSVNRGHKTSVVYDLKTTCSGCVFWRLENLQRNEITC